MKKEAPTERPHRGERLNLRATTHQHRLIRSAAAALDTSVTDFVLSSATANAERVLADRRWFTLSDHAWDEFVALLDAPVGASPKLERLLREPTVFDDEVE